MNLSNRFKQMRFTMALAYGMRFGKINPINANEGERREEHRTLHPEVFVSDSYSQEHQEEKPISHEFVHGSFNDFSQYGTIEDILQGNEKTKTHEFGLPHRTQFQDRGYTINPDILPEEMDEDNIGNKKFWEELNFRNPLYHQTEASSNGKPFDDETIFHDESLTGCEDAIPMVFNPKTGAWEIPKELER